MTTKSTASPRRINSTELSIMAAWRRKFERRLSSKTLPSHAQTAWPYSAEFRNARLEVRDTLNGCGKS